MVGQSTVRLLSFLYLAWPNKLSRSVYSNNIVESGILILSHAHNIQGQVSYPPLWGSGVQVEEEMSITKACKYCASGKIVLFYFDWLHFVVSSVDSQK